MLGQVSAVLKLDMFPIIKLLKYPRHKEGLRVFERFYKEHIIISVARRGDAREVVRCPKTVVTV